MARNIIDWQSGPASYIVGGLLLEIGNNLVYQQHSKGTERKCLPSSIFFLKKDVTLLKCSKGEVDTERKRRQRRVIDPAS